MAYEVELSPAAERQLAKLPREDQARLVAAMDSLQVEPRPPGATKLKGQDNTYRLRVGQYRLIYDIYDRVLWLIILRVGHRKEIYRGDLMGQALRSCIARRLLDKE